MSPSPLLPFDPIGEARQHWVDRGWTDAATGMAAVTSVMRVQQILLGRIDEQLRDFDLTFARYEVLMLLSFSREGALPLRVIGSRLQVHPTSVTSAVDRLEAQQYVCRKPHPTDRRTKLATLTSSGRDVAAAATERLNATVFADVGLPEAKLEQLIDVLRDVRVHAGDF